MTRSIRTLTPLAVTGALVAALFGLAPDALKLAWVALGACFLLWFLGPLLDLPSWILDLSPYEHIPAVPAADLAVGPLLALTAVAAGLVVAGLVAFRRRDTA
jgi:ABC-2 type transport system permease protein